MNEFVIQAIGFVGSPCTLIYDVLIGSWGGAVTEGMALASIIVSIRRFGWNNLDNA